MLLLFLNIFLFVMSSENVNTIGHDATHLVKIVMVLVSSVFVFSSSSSSSPSPPPPPHPLPPPPAPSPHLPPASRSKVTVQIDRTLNTGCLQMSSPSSSFLCLVFLLFSKSSSAVSTFSSSTPFFSSFSASSSRCQCDDIVISLIFFPHP